MGECFVAEGNVRTTEWRERGGCSGGVEQQVPPLHARWRWRFGRDDKGDVEGAGETTSCDDQRPTTNDQRPTTEDQRLTTEDWRLTANYRPGYYNSGDVLL